MMMMMVMVMVMMMIMVVVVVVCIPPLDTNLPLTSLSDSPPHPPHSVRRPPPGPPEKIAPQQNKSSPLAALQPRSQGLKAKSCAQAPGQTSSQAAVSEGSLRL